MVKAARGSSQAAAVEDLKHEIKVFAKVFADIQKYLEKMNFNETEENRIENNNYRKTSVFSAAAAKLEVGMSGNGPSSGNAAAARAVNMSKLRNSRYLINVPEFIGCHQTDEANENSSNGEEVGDCYLVLEDITKTKMCEAVGRREVAQGLSLGHFRGKQFILTDSFFTP